MTHHKHLQNVVEDQLSLAAMHYLRTHYQEAIDVYKKLLLEKRCAVVPNKGISLLISVALPPAGSCWP